MSVGELVDRIVFASIATSPGREDFDAIVAASRRNNPLDGISGILWFEDGRYLQLLEGPPDSLVNVFDRISGDPRHTGIVIVERSSSVPRVFADWSMASLPGERPDDAAQRLRNLLRQAPIGVARYFPVSGV